MIATQEAIASANCTDPSVRRGYIGSSDAPAILGCGFAGETAHTVWARKMGWGEEMEDSDLLLCGRVLQPAICELLRIKTGYDVRPHDETRLLHPEYPWLGATPDAFIHGDPRGLGNAELKNVGSYNAGEWHGEPPLRVQVQLQTQLLVTGATWGIACALVGGNKLVYREFSLHQRLIDAMLPALREFWRHVEDGTPPPIDGSAGCTAMLKSLYPEDRGTAVALPPQSGQWFDELTALKSAAKWLKERKSAVENRIKAALGEAAIGTLPDGREFRWQTQTSHYEAKPAYDLSFRVLRQHVPKSRGIAQAKGVTPDTLATRFSTCTMRLLSMGATLYHESESGSRYFELSGGLRVRVADHPPNERTAAWMGRGEVAGVRVDEPYWDDQLEAITGNDTSESEGDE